MGYTGKLEPEQMGGSGPAEREALLAVRKRLCGSEALPNAPGHQIEGGLRLLTAWRGRKRPSWWPWGR
jgi:hypothetical protein